jgi:hypothetical protein
MNSSWCEVIVTDSCLALHHAQSAVLPSFHMCSLDSVEHILPRAQPRITRLQLTHIQYVFYRKHQPREFREPSQGGSPGDCKLQAASLAGVDLPQWIPTNRYVKLS